MTVPDQETIAILPLGAYEQHGPHLPMETDAIIAGALAVRLAAAVEGRLPVELLPVEPVGYSPEHLDFPGSRSLRYDEAVERWLGIAGAVRRRGIRKLVMLNAHGGNSPLTTIVATEARVRFSMLAVATSWTRFGVPEGLIEPGDKAIDIHAGAIETSVMLALAPGRVAMDRARDFPSFQRELIGANRHLRAYGPHAFGWKMRDLNPDGAAGNAAAATAALGERIVAHALAGLVELLGEVHRFDLAHLDRADEARPPA